MWKGKSFCSNHSPPFFNYGQIKNILVSNLKNVGQQIGSFLLIHIRCISGGVFLKINWLINLLYDPLLYTRISGRYAPFILGPAGGDPGVGASPLLWGSAPFLGLCPYSGHQNSENVKIIFFYKFPKFCQSPFQKWSNKKKILKVAKSPETPRNVENFDFNFFFIRNLFLTLEDVPDSWDGDQEPKMVSISSQRPYLSFAKRLGSIPSSSSEILMHVTRVTIWCQTNTQKYRRTVQDFN